MDLKLRCRWGWREQVLVCNTQSGSTLRPLTWDLMDPPLQPKPSLPNSLSLPLFFYTAYTSRYHLNNLHHLHCIMPLARSFNMDFAFGFWISLHCLLVGDAILYWLILCLSLDLVSLVNGIDGLDWNGEDLYDSMVTSLIVYGNVLSCWLILWGVGQVIWLWHVSGVWIRFIVECFRCYVLAMILLFGGLAVETLDVVLIYVGVFVFLIGVKSMELLATK